MAASLLDKKTAKQFRTIAEKKARLSQREVNAAKSFMEKTDKNTILSILDISEKYGHPKEQELSRELRYKYKEGLDFDEILSLDELFKSNSKYYINKEKGHE